MNPPRPRTRLVVLMAALICGALAAAVLVAVTPAGSVDAGRAEDFGIASCKTDRYGDCTLPHGLGRTPDVVLVTPQGPAELTAAADDYTEGTFRLRTNRERTRVSVVYLALAGSTPATTAPSSGSTGSTSSGASTAPPPAPSPTTTAPTPTGTPTGTQPATGNFPTAATTGPTGALATVNGDLHSTANGQVIDSKDVRGWIVVRHTGVTIKNSRMRILDLRDSNGTVVEDSVIEPGPGQYDVDSFPPTLVDDTAGWTLRRTEVRGWQDGPRTAGGTVLIEDSLLHDLAFVAGEHPDGYQQYCPGCTSKVTLRHNSISGCAGNSSDKGSSAMFWSDHPGAGSTIRVENNLFSCGQYSIRINDATNGSGVRATVTGNVVQRNSYALGPAECANSDPFNGTAGVEWSGNTYSDGAPLGSPC